MKRILRFYLINTVSLWMTTEIIPGLTFSGGMRSLFLGGAAFAVINLILVPLLRILFLPLNILTLGIFSWVINVLALYALTTIVADFMLLPYYFPGAVFLGISMPAMDLTPFWVAVLASFLIGFITHFLQWLSS